MQKRGLANYLENLLNSILNIFHRSGPRAPDPKPDPHPWIYLINILLSLDHVSLDLGQKGPNVNGQKGSKARWPKRSGSTILILFEGNEAVWNRLSDGAKDLVPRLLGMDLLRGGN